LTIDQVITDWTARCRNDIGGYNLEYSLTDNLDKLYNLDEMGIVGKISSSPPPPSTPRPITKKMLASALLALLPLVAASPVARQDGVNAESLKVLAQRQNKYIGTAYQSFYLADERFEPILDGEFDQYTPENEMKWEVIQAERGVFNWTGADLVRPPPCRYF
jgi:hypothetical protein